MRYTVVIQGPLNPRSLENLDHYLAVGDVVISFWDTDNLSLLDCVPKTDRIKLRRNSLHEMCHNDWNIFYHAVTSFGGISLVNTEFVIKVRSDESYENLAPIKDALDNEPNKIVTNNVFFRADKNFKFHPSDHLVAGKTTVLLNAFRNLHVMLCHHFTPFDGSGRLQMFDDHNKPINAVPEVMICVHTLRAMGEQVSVETSRDIMQKHYVIVPISRLGKVTYVANYCHGVYSESDVPENSINAIGDI